MNPRCFERIGRDLHRAVLHVVLHGNRVAPARQTDRRLVHDDIAETADDLPVAFVVARRAADIAGIETDTERGAALLHDDDAYGRPSDAWKA